MSTKSKKITILNAANIFSQSLFTSVRGFNRIHVGDLYNCRKSVKIFKFTYSINIIFLNFIIFSSYSNTQIINLIKIIKMLISHTEISIQLP